MQAKKLLEEMIYVRDSYNKNNNPEELAGKLREYRLKLIDVHGFVRLNSEYKQAIDIFNDLIIDAFDYLKGSETNKLFY